MRSGMYFKRPKRESLDFREIRKGRTSVSFFTLLGGEVFGELGQCVDQMIEGRPHLVNRFPGEYAERHEGRHPGIQAELIERSIRVEFVFNAVRITRLVVTPEVLNGVQMFFHAA